MSPSCLTSNLYFPGDVSTIVSRLGKDDGQGGKFGIDQSAITAPGLVTLTSFGMRNVPTTLESLRNQPYSVANLSITKNFQSVGNQTIPDSRGSPECVQPPVLRRGHGIKPGNSGGAQRRFRTGDHAA